MFVSERVGRIWIVEGTERLDEPFLDIAGQVTTADEEQGFLSMVFHPDFRHNGHFYVNYTNLSGDTIISRFTTPADSPDRADPNSETIILEIIQPETNHNGGHLAFGPDGYLYISMGDGGGVGDSFSNAQSGGTLLGKILRIDVDHGNPYAIPPDNPFSGTINARGEIWAMGLRNPWRFSFDRLNGDLYLGDVGEDAREEINIQPAGQGGLNYGWPLTEGSACFEGRSCDPGRWRLPVVDYGRDLGCSVVGGYVYRGQQFAFLRGIYLFGDFCSGIIWALGWSDGEWQMIGLVSAGFAISSFAENQAGELYVVDFNGAIYQIAARRF